MRHRLTLKFNPDSTGPQNRRKTIAGILGPPPKPAKGQFLALSDKCDFLLDFPQIRFILWITKSEKNQRKISESIANNPGTGGGSSIPMLLMFLRDRATRRESHAQI